MRFIKTGAIYIVTMKKYFDYKIVSFLLFSLLLFKTAAAEEFPFRETGDDSSRYKLELGIESLHLSFRLNGIKGVKSTLYLIEKSSGEWLFYDFSGDKAWKPYSVTDSVKDCISSIDWKGSEAERINYLENLNLSVCCYYHKGLKETFENSYLGRVLLPFEDSYTVHVLLCFSKGYSDVNIKVTDSGLSRFASGDGIKDALKNDGLVRKIFRETLLGKSPFNHLYDEGNKALKAYLVLLYSNCLNMFFAQNEAKYGIDYSALTVKTRKERYESHINVSTELLKLYKTLSFYEKEEKRAESGISENEYGEKKKELNDLIKASLSFTATHSSVLPALSCLTDGDALVVYENGRIVREALIISVFPYYFSYEDEVLKKKVFVIEPSVSEKTLPRLRTLESFLAENEGACAVTKLFPCERRTEVSDRSWNVLTGETPTVAFTCSEIYEETQLSQDEKFPWIPDTGEWLCISGIKAGTGIFKNAVIRLKGAEDCNASASGSESSNIYRNRADSFELKVTDSEGVELTSGRLVRKRSGPEYIYEGTGDASFKSDSLGNLLSQEGRPVRFSVRPSSWEQSFTGDDIRLSFTVDAAGYNDLEVFLEDRLAVYDKKLISRGNLYIDETFSVKNAVDWNIVHPWNAPCSENHAAQAPSWWNPGWGYNEWNRKFEFDDIRESINDHEMADGKQCVSFAPYSGLRSASSARSVRDCVSYDYNKNDINRAWDSPFDFNWKMNLQKKAIAAHFTAVISEGNEDTESEPGKFYINDGEVFDGNSVSNLALSSWDTCEAPNSFWQFYWKDDDQKTLYPYINGFGFFQKSLAETQSDRIVYANIESKKFWSGVKFNSQLSAGTDCVGFALRCASYKNSRYSWVKNNTIADGIAEGSEHPDSLVRSLSNPDFNGALKTYEDILTWEDFVYSGIDMPGKYCDKTENDGLDYYKHLEFIGNIKKKILLAVPGDIISFGSNIHSENKRNFGSHIGVIQNIDIEKLKSALTLREVLDSVEVIESVYSGMLFGVVKRTMSQSGSGSERTPVSSGKMYQGSWIADGEGFLRRMTVCRLLYN